MFQFERGDTTNLEGKVLLYTNLHICENPEHSLVAGMYGTSDSDDLISKLSNMGMEIEDFPEQLRQLTEQLVRGHDSSRGFMLYYVGFHVESVEPLRELPPDHDLIFVGDFASQRNGSLALQAAAQLYSSHYIEQTESKIRDGTLSHSAGKTPTFAYRISPVKTHKDFKGLPIGEYVSTVYVGTMIDAIAQGDRSRFDKLRQEFTEFCNGSHFMADAQQISVLIKEGAGKKPNVPLIEAYLTKMGLIHREDYSGAAALRDQIRQMTSR